MDFLGLFSPGCAPSSQIEINGSSLVEAHLQHRSSNLGCLRGVSSDHSCLFSTRRTYITLQRVSTWASTAMRTMDTWTALFLRSGPGTTGCDIQSRVMHSRDRELDELEPFQAPFGKDTVYLAWKSS